MCVAAPSGRHARSAAAGGDNAAVLAESIGERPHRHAVVLTSRRWRGGHDSEVAETRRDNLISTQKWTPFLARSWGLSEYFVDDVRT